MCTYPPGTFQFAERTMELTVRDALRQAESDRMARRAQPYRCCYGALAWLGEQLATWGLDLQERYGSQGKRSVRRSTEGLAS